MPDLESHLAAWRVRLAQELAGQDAVLDELEAHVRDGAEALIQDGVPADEAFHRMTARFGDAPVVAREFRLLEPAGIFTFFTRRARGWAYVAGTAGLAGFLYFFVFAMWRITTLGRARLLPAEVQRAEFWLGMAVLLTLVCFLVVRASHRFLTRPNGPDLRGLVAFNLLTIWMVSAQGLIRLSLGYTVTVMLVLLLLGAVTLIWWHYRGRKTPNLVPSP